MRKINIHNATFQLGFAFLIVVAGCLLIWTGGYFTGEKVAERADAVYIENEEAEEMGLLFQQDVIDYAKLRPSRAPTEISFCGKSTEEIGRLDWTDGKFKFVGAADQSAKIFFEGFLKPYVDAYIEDELERRKDATTK